MGSVIKKRRKRMAKKKHRKLLRKTRHQRRNKKWPFGALASMRRRASTPEGWGPSSSRYGSTRSTMCRQARREAGLAWPPSFS